MEKKQQTTIRLDKSIRDKLRLACALTTLKTQEWIEKKADEDIKKHGLKVKK